MTVHRAARPTAIVCALAAMVLGAATVLTASPAFAAQPPVGLGTAGSFAVLAGSGITNTGPTTINGDVGTFPTPTMTGFSSVVLTGTNHAGDAVTQGAKADLQTAYNDAAGRTPVTSVAVQLGGRTLQTGVYVSPTLGLTGTLTLDAKGDPDATFIFKASSTLITESNSRVVLLNGANPCRVVWQVGSSATFKTGTSFVGDVLAHTSITAQTAATFRGRLLALNGAVTLDTNTITNSTCAASSGGGTTTTTTTTGGSTTDTIGGTGGTTGTTVPGDTTGTTTGPDSGPDDEDDSTTFAGPRSPINGPGSPDETPLTPGTPGTPGTPATPETPGRPLLPYTGVEIVGTLAVAAALVAFGTLIVRTTRHNRRALLSS